MVFFAVRDLPPSAERILHALSAYGPSTHGDLVRLTGLPPRTLRFALRRLREDGHLEWRLSLKDARRRIYFLARNATGLPLST